MHVPHTRPAVWPSLRPGRFASRFSTSSATDCRLALLGLADDTGVRLNRGRPGAAQGPGAFRAALASFGTAWDGDRRRELDVGVFDAGDVTPAPGNDEDALFETHRRVESAVRALHEQNLCVVCVGGGHDLSLPALTALSKSAGHALGGVNFDAHLDVRQTVGSGMPFRRLIEGGHLDPRRFVEFGLGRFANERHDYEWLAQRGATLVSAEDVRRQHVSAEALLTRVVAGEPGFVSIDLDGFDGCLAPGVSALNPHGLGVEPAAELAEAAGKLPNVRHFDLMELCPEHDVDARTAKLAAYLLLCFCAGFMERRE